MSDANEDLGNRLGSFFKKVTLAFLPAVVEATNRTSKEVTFGATVKVQKDESGVLVCRVQPHEPKIPTDPVAPVFFTATETAEGQIQYLMPGGLKEFNAEIAKGEQPDDYTPVDNAKMKT